MGALLGLSFVGSASAHGGFFIAFLPPLTAVSPGEGNLWRSAVVLLAPALACLAASFAPTLLTAWEALRAEARSVGASRRALLVALGLLAVSVAGLSHVFALQNLPLTDDEIVARFGGQLLASGRLAMDDPFPAGVIPDRFLFHGPRGLSSTEWPGGQWAWAVAQLTGLGSWLFALVAGLTASAIAATLGRRRTSIWSLLAGALFISSPLAFGLSSTTHTHLLPRAAVAGGLWGFSLATRWWHWLLVGLALGLGLTARPIEVGFLVGPFALVMAWGDRRRAVSVVPWVALGAALPVVPMVLTSWVLTGQLMPLRFQPGAVMDKTEVLGLWDRFGTNVGFKVGLLALWFAGPLGAALVAFGAWATRFTRALGVGSLSLLSVGLFHTAIGIHAVGPINQSLLAVPFTIMAVYGAQRVWHWSRRRGAGAWVLPALTVAALLWNVIFCGFYAFAWHAQAEAQRVVWDAFEALSEREKVVVLGPPFESLLVEGQDRDKRGSWVNSWKRPAPDWTDRVIVLHDGPGALELVRRTFPDRAIFRFDRTGDQFELKPVP